MCFNSEILNSVAVMLRVFLPAMLLCCHKVERHKGRAAEEWINIELKSLRIVSEY